MIEVERKFQINEEQKKRLLVGAQFIGKKIYVDSYYDTPEYTLTRDDVWLRDRSGKFELKISLNKDITRAADQYEELETEEEIRKRISLPAHKSLLEDLQAHGYETICVCTTTRAKYKKDEFSIDIDEVVYEDGSTYNLMEIELMVNEPSQMDGAIKRIMAFARKEELDDSSVGGKVHHYIKQYRPEHFKLLVELGVLRNV